MIEENLLYPSNVRYLFDQHRLESWKSQKKYTFKRGEQVSYPGEYEQEILLIVQGNVRIFHIHRDGKECVLGILTAGDFIDLPSVFTDRDSDAYSIALTQVSVVKVSQKEIIDEVKSNPELSFSLLQHFSNRLQDVVHVLEQVAYEKVEARLLTILKKLVEPDSEQNGWYPLPAYITHRDIAGMIASTRETVTFLLNKLSQTDVIRNEQNRLWLAKSACEQSDM